MTSIVIEQFGGIAPKIDPRQLANSLAQTASNCLVAGLALEPTKDAGTTGSTVGAAAASMYYYAGSAWLDSVSDKTWAEVPIANDALARVVSTNASTYPEVYTGQGPLTFRLGIPAPAAAPAIEFFTADAGNPETLSYVHTYVDVWGSEGPPSAPSASITREGDTNVELSLSAAPGGAYNFGVGALIRIYRSNNGNYQFVKEVPIATAGAANQANGGDTIDNIATGNLGEIIPTTGWIGPPDDNTTLYPNGPMKQIIALPNGILAGFAHKTLVFSEPFVYYAWPAEYRITFDQPIVGLAAIQSGVLVCTEGASYVVMGVSPSAMATVRLETPHVCVARKSIVDMGAYAIYAAEEGLVLVQGNTATLVTEAFFSRINWQSYYPTTISAFQWEGKYLGFYTGGGTSAGFIFDPRGGANSFIRTSTYYPVGYYYPKSNTTFVKSATSVITFGRGNDSHVYTWKSKKFVVERPLSFAWVRIEAWNALVTATVSVKVWADGELIITLTMNDSATPYARLPGGFRAKIWEIEVVGSNPLTRIGLYESAEEMV